MNKRMPRLLMDTSLAGVLVSFCLAASPHAAQQETTATSRATTMTARAVAAEVDPATFRQRNGT